jgi:hypothetical protein
MVDSSIPVTSDASEIVNQWRDGSVMTWVMGRQSLPFHRPLTRQPEAI